MLTGPLRAARLSAGCSLAVAACLCAARAATKDAKNTNPPALATAAQGIIDARKALGDGLPQVAAVKAGRLLETKGLTAKDRREVAGIAVEAWVRARDGIRARELLDREPKIDHAPFWTGHALVLLGDLNGAVEAFGKWREMGELAEHARLALAFALMADGREGAARTELKELRGSQDAAVASQARLLLSELELVAGRSDVVLQRLTRENNTPSAEVQFLRARGLLQLGDAAKAGEVTRELLARPGIHGTVHDAAVVLGAEAMLAQKKADEALRVLVQFLDKARDPAFWHEAFELLNRCRSALRGSAQIPLAVAAWVGEDVAPERRAYAMFWLARWLDEAGRKVEALGMIEAFLQLHPGHRNESEAMRLAMKLNGELRADARVFDLAKEWRQQYGGGGDSLVDFISGGILFARGDLVPALAAFQRASDEAATLPERRRALHNAAVTAVKAGQMAVYQALLSKIEVAGTADADTTKTQSGKGDTGTNAQTKSDTVPAAVPLASAGSAAASLELDRALQLAAKGDASAEVEVQRFISANPEHPRWAEAQITRAELALLDVPPRVKDAGVALQAAMQKKGIGTATRERIDYVTVWLREAEENLRGVADAGLAFLKTWPASPLADQIRMKTGEAYYRMQDFPDARTQFELLASDHPGSEYADAALFFAGKAAMELMTPEGLQRAIQIWGELAEHGGPMAASARYQQALAKRRMGQEKEALAIIDTLLSDKSLDKTMRLQAQCQRIELQLVLGRSDAKQSDAAVAAARELQNQPGLAYLWRGRIGALLTQALQDSGRTAEALEACYDIVNAGIDAASGPANPAEFFWFYWAGFRAVNILESQKQWEAAAKMAETLAQTAGDRATEAKDLATRIRMEHFLWDEK
ncbi:MAG: tetratricopeptide repeat protein [Verrucomicrobiaceae bacterium]|nr:tetratricopeptide repeat protein [Verrucomicrobiaceae bacterium]